MKSSILTFFLMVAANSSTANGWPDPVTDADYVAVPEAEAILGQLLFYDPILSGNQNISCATCHHPNFATSDGLSLGIGEGGIGLGPDRRLDPDNPPEARIPRNSPALFNLGAREFTVMFHDGRIEADPTRATGLRTPLGADMEVGFASVLSAQTMFPVLSDDEMAGQLGENAVSLAVRTGQITGPGGAWDIIARRVGDIPEYEAAFVAAYPQINSGADIHFTDISNAIAAFIAFEWRSDQSAFDAALRGDRALPEAAQRGADLFYGPAQCAACHSGAFQTDHSFHAMGTPQLGPGKAASFEDHARDDGRFRVTGDEADRFAFRTPSLRNVTRTGPWGHGGGHLTLDGFIRFHADPVAGLAGYENQASMPDLEGEDWVVMSDAVQRAALAEAVVAAPVELSPAEVADIVAFLTALEDETALRGRLGIPDAVPSGLPVDR